MGWRSQAVITDLVLITGANDGEFIYDANGNLREAGVGATTTDPIQGLTCPAGRSFWNGQGAILLLISDSNDAIFQYFDNNSAVQGGLVAALATAGGTDPVTATNYFAGNNNINPAFGQFSIVVGSRVDFGIGTLMSQNARIDVASGSGAVSPAMILFAPEQGVSGHLVMVMQGTSPDGSHLGQLLMARVPTGFTSPAPGTNSLLEVQGAIDAVNVNAIVAGAEETWHDVATGVGFANGWLNTGGGVVLTQYRKTVLNRVEIVGDLTVPVAGPNTVIFTLPAGYRPASTQQVKFVVVSQVGGAAQLTDIRAFVNNTGVVNAQNIPAGLTSMRIAFASGSSISLDA